MPSEPWEEIARRCEEASGPDDDLAGTLMCAVAGKPFGRTERGTGDDGSDDLWVFAKGFDGDDDGDVVWCRYAHDAPDRSVDAILALIAEKLPGRDIVSVSIVPGEGGAQASIEHAMDPCAHHEQTIAATPALALCSALARALATQARAEVG